jgi:hypothetical protein
MVVNSVIATGIFDKELKDFCNWCWEKAFQVIDNNSDLKATIVIKHLIQASNICHTMQH